MAKRVIFVILTIFHGYQLTSAGDLYSSMSDMQELYEKENLVTEKMEKFTNLLDRQIDKLEYFLTTFYKNHNYTEEDAEEYVSDPLNTFALIKRTGLEWPIVRDLLFGNETKSQIDDLLEILDGFDIKESDLQGALNGLRLLMNTYQFNLTEFSRGKIKIPEAQRIDMDISEEYFEDHPLIVHDLHLLGQLAYNENNIAQSYEILKAAEQMAKETNDPLYKEIKGHAKTVMKKHDELLIRSEFVDPKYTLYDKPIDPELAKKKKFAKLSNTKKYPKLFNLQTDPNNAQILFDAACRGENIRKPKDDIGTNCKYLHYFNPYLQLGPFKMETKNLDPFVAIFRDFFSENEIESYLNEAENSGEMKRSTHGGKKFGQDTTFVSSYSRTSKQLWLQEFQPEMPEGLVWEGRVCNISKQVTLRIQNATLMNAFTAHGGEAFQVANYGIGGQYSKHLDASGADRIAEGYKGIGDRIQTFMGYLADVEAGGATVFPMLGLSIWPKKGDAITWYNLKRNGENDSLTLHGGCPVIKGSKWITNKWIRQYPQILNFPCSVNPYKAVSFKPLENNICNLIPSCKPRFGFGTYDREKF